MSDEKPKGIATNLPGSGEILIKGSIVKPPPSTPQDSVSPPPAAVPGTSSTNETPQASK